MDFTCTLKQNAATVASTTTSATYVVRDGWATCQFLLTATAAGTVGTEAKVTPASLPAPLATGHTSAGSFVYNDGGTYYEGSIRWDGTDLIFRVHNTASSLGVAPSFAVANGDTLSATFTFPVA